jgi:hypothetical protein
VFPNYEIDDCGDDGGRISFVPTKFEGYQSNNTIEFQRSRLDLCVLNCASAQVKEDVRVMEGMLKVIQKEVEEIEA